MHKNNYLKVLNSLDSKETKEFALYLSINYPRQKVARQIHDYFSKHKNRTFTDFETVHREIFKKSVSKASADKKISSGFSDLFLHLKDFLVQREILKADFAKEFLWLQILEKKELNRLKDAQAKKMKDKLTKVAQPKLWSPLQRFQLLHHDYFRNDRKKLNNSTHQEMLSALDDFYLSARLKLNIETINFENIIGQNESSNKDEEIFNLIKKQVKLSPLNQFYVMLYEFKKQASDDKAQTIFDFLQKKHRQLPPDENLIALVNIANYWNAAIRKAKLGAVEKTMSIYKFGVDNNIIVYNDSLDVDLFNNIVSTACLNKELVWGKNFIQSHCQFLTLAERESSHNLALASIALLEGENETVIKLLNSIEVSAPLPTIRMHTLLIRALYQLKEYGLVNDKCNNFIRYVRRKKLSESIINATINFAQLLKQFIEVNNTRDDLTEKTLAQNPLFCREWFLEEAAKW